MIEMNTWDLAYVLLALYKNTKAIGMGVLHSREDLTASDMFEILDSHIKDRNFSQWFKEKEITGSSFVYRTHNGYQDLYIDYLAGRPFKIKFRHKEGVWCLPDSDPFRLYNRDSYLVGSEVLRKALRLGEEE